MSRPGVEPVGAEHSRKEPFEQLVNRYSGHLRIYDPMTICILFSTRRHKKLKPIKHSQEVPY
jgi:hypothetical protein